MTPEQQTARAGAFYVMAIGGGRPAEAVAQYVGRDYIQHNPEVATGPDAFIAHFESFAKDYPPIEVSVVRGFSHKSLAFIHVVQDLGKWGLWATMDLFRFEDDLIVEHWDNLTQVPDRTAFHGPSTPLEATADTAERVRQFVERALLKGWRRPLLKALGADFEHRVVGAEPGVEGLVGWFERWQFARLHHVMAADGFAVVVLEGHLDEAHRCLWLLFRIEDDHIGWLWGIDDAVRARQDQPHANGKFGYRYTR